MKNVMTRLLNGTIVVLVGLLGSNMIFSNGTIVVLVGLLGSNMIFSMDDAALHDAAELGGVAGIERLLAAGANANALDKYGNTPLDLVARSGVAYAGFEGVRRLLSRYNRQQDINKKVTTSLLRACMLRLYDKRMFQGAWGNNVPVELKDRFRSGQFFREQ